MPNENPPKEDPSIEDPPKEDLPRGDPPKENWCEDQLKEDLSRDLDNLYHRNGKEQAQKSEAGANESPRRLRAYLPAGRGRNREILGWGTGREPNGEDSIACAHTMGWADMRARISTVVYCLV